MTEQGTHSDYIDRHGNCDLCGVKCGLKHALPPARVHVTRAPRRLLFFAAVLVALGCSAFGTLLSRIDTAREAAAIATAESHRAYAHTAILEARLVQLANRPAPKPLAVDEVCRTRTEALRGAIKALVRLERVAMPNDPGPEWITWR